MPLFYVRPPKWRLLLPVPEGKQRWKRAYGHWTCGTKGRATWSRAATWQRKRR